MRNLTPSEAAVLNQGIPSKGTGPAIINLVLDDLKDYPDTLKTSFIKRAAKGEAYYGYPLQANNGRDSLIDLYQEVVDGVLYHKQLLEELEEYSDDWHWIFSWYHHYIDFSKGLHDMILERGEEK